MVRDKILTVIVLLIVFFSVISSPINLTFASFINNVEIYVHVNYNRNVTYRLATDLVFTELQNISSIEAYMKYSQLDYEYMSKITYIDNLHRNSKMKNNSWRMEDLRILRKKENKYHIDYERNIIYNSNGSSNISLCMEMTVHKPKNNYISINSIMEVKTTHLEDIFQFNVTILLFRNIAKNSTIITKYDIEKKNNVTYYTGWANITNAVLDISSISNKIIKYYLGSYAPIILIDNPIKVLKLIDKLHISTLYTGKTFLFEEKSSGLISILLLNQTPLYVEVNGDIDSYLLKPPKAYPVYGSYSFAVEITGNNELHGKLYVEYAYNYGYEFVNKFFKDVGSYIEDIVAKNVNTFKINLWISNGTLVYNSGIYNELHLDHRNYTLLYNIVYNIEETKGESPKQAIDYMSMTIVLLVIIAIVISYFLLHRRKKL